MYSHVQEQQTTRVLFPQVSSAGRVNRCSQPELEGAICLRFPSSPHSEQGSEEGGTGGSGYDTDSTNMDQERVVPTSSGPFT